MTHIGEYAFAWCRSLVSVTITNVNIDVRFDAFSKCGEDMVIRAPAGSCAERYAAENGIKYTAI